MEKTTFVLSIALLISILLAGIFFIQVLTLKTQLQEATALARAAKDLVNYERKTCRNPPEDLNAIRLCILAKLKALETKEEHTFTKEDVTFHNANPNKEETGYLILAYEGDSALNSSEFKLFKNKVLVDSGCLIEGTITKGYTCRLDFNTTCQRGDVLEVKYGKEQAYLHTC
ncbi:hypothetical protein D6783_00635 [Candidatus Woesearchaeota archaeon]|nr:MAG: hypothetical protein D6783_00635 [Candidatus Woesearchaeota archaeon]